MPKVDAKWVVTGKDLAVFTRVQVVVGWVFVALLLPLVILILLGEGASRVQGWISSKIVYNLSVWSTCLINQMWKNRVPDADWQDRQLGEFHRIRKDN